MASSHANFTFYILPGKITTFTVSTRTLRYTRTETELLRKPAVEEWSFHLPHALRCAVTKLCCQRAGDGYAWHFYILHHTDPHYARFSTHCQKKNQQFFIFFKFNLKVQSLIFIRILKDNLSIKKSRIESTERADKNSKLN